MGATKEEITQGRLEKVMGNRRDGFVDLLARLNASNSNTPTPQESDGEEEEGVVEEDAVRTKRLAKEAKRKEKEDRKALKRKRRETEATEETIPTLVETVQIEPVVDGPESIVDVPAPEAVVPSVAAMPFNARMA